MGGVGRDLLAPELRLFFAPKGRATGLVRKSLTIARNRLSSQRANPLPHSHKSLALGHIHIQAPNQSALFTVQTKYHHHTRYCFTITKICITLAREARRTKTTPSQVFIFYFDSYFNHYYASSARSADFFKAPLETRGATEPPSRAVLVSRWWHLGVFSSKSAQISLTSVFILFAHVF